MKKPIDYVKPNIGTIGHLLTSTQPTVSLPHGMLQVAPIVTPGIKDHYLADKIFGFSTGSAMIMASQGKLGHESFPIASTYDHDIETTTPYYHAVLLEDTEIYAEYTVSYHSMYYRFSFPEGKDSTILISMPNQPCQLECLDSNKITGWVAQSGVTLYLYVEFSKPFQSTLFKSGDNGELTQFVQFETSAQEQISVKVGVSYLSIEQAQKNLLQEINNWDFEEVKSTAYSIWNEALSKIEVDGGSEEQRTIFYTALYRSMLHMNNITEDGKYYSGYDNKVHFSDKHDFYTNDNMWDSYRCLHPLQLLLEPQRQMDMIVSYLRMYEQSGWLPQFPAVAGDRPFMTGNHAAAMIVDTFMKGYAEFDLEVAYAAIKKNAMESTMLPWVIGGLTELEKVYMEKGFFPALKKAESEWVQEVDGFERRQAVSVTLEHAYDDWCIAQMAKALNYMEDYQYFMNRAQNYKHVFDERIGFMAPKSADGHWVVDFDPKLSGGQGGRDYFAECNSWIYTFHVQHDLAGLIELLGGREQFAAKLDSLFVEQYGTSKYEFLNQFPDSTGLMGQYCQGNEPAFHIPYLYNYAGMPWKTQRKAREIMKVWYTDSPLGICGDEDAGAMSSWYVFSAMGFYPVCPGKPFYDIGSPIFEKVTINLDQDKTFIIQANGASEINKYIQSAYLNGQLYDKPYLEHADIVGGGTLILQMGHRPNKQWGLSGR
ncbi:glycoside hydrolase family 92 protein [Paenibacillus psychroresistens]|uniref:Glycoside hydrolase family 92 protein n=1 Tax=Paenibacillus psychroresistens TaxID=1778678 RepID=A0A6B8RLU7_9BACL|nr:GH92 family glycosyl hydrolase [Paenibacillus psychroresistens]QGQ97290.1 glycoside hydrolase family 92 protein [Paenibacillus psychroresistens]